MHFHIPIGKLASPSFPFRLRRNNNTPLGMIQHRAVFIPKIKPGRVAVNIEVIGFTT